MATKKALLSKGKVRKMSAGIEGGRHFSVNVKADGKPSKVGGYGDRYPKPKGKK